MGKGKSMIGCIIPHINLLHSLDTDGELQKVIINFRAAQGLFWHGLPCVTTNIYPGVDVHLTISVPGISSINC